MMSNSNIDNIILFDSNLSIDNVKDFLKQPNTLIISFDINSNKKLDENKFLYKISDDWIDENEYENIQNHVYKLSYWFENPEIIGDLNYDGINLGELILGDLLYFLPEFISNFSKIKNIFLQNPNSNFIATGFLYNIINKFTSNIFLIKSKQVKKNNDKIKINVKIFNKTIPLSISTSKYLSVKKNMEHFLNYFLNSKKLSKNNNLLLVNFHTEKYVSLFDKSRDNSTELFIYNTLMPNFWNYDTFSTIKKSKCHIINDPSLSTSVKEKCKHNISKLKNRSEQLWNKEDFFESFFIYEDISFWAPFKDYFLSLFENKIPNYLIQIEKIKIILDKYKIKNVLIWSETNPVDVIFLQLRNTYGHKVFKLQHGLYPESEISDNFCNAFRIYGLKSDNFFVWGNSSKLQYLNRGFPDKKIIITGSVTHDPVFQKENSPPVKNDYVLLGTNSPIGIFADELSNSIRQEYEDSIKIICREVIKSNKKLIVKLHPAIDQMDLTSIIHKIDPSIPIFRRGELTKLMADCELYVNVGVSTSILDALIANKPVIYVETSRHDIGKLDVFNYILNTNTENFGDTLKKVISDVTLYDSLVKKGNTYVKKYFSNHGKAAFNLLNYVKNIEQV
jgi:hypothetical protein